MWKPCVLALAVLAGVDATTATRPKPKPQMLLAHPQAAETAPFHWAAREQEVALSAADVSQSVMHLSGVPAVTTRAAKLPAANVAAPPKANVLLSIDGVDHGHDVSTMPFVHEHPHRANVEQAPWGQPGMTGEVATRVHNGMAALDLPGYTMCVSADETVSESPLCANAQDSVAWDVDESRFSVRNSDRLHRTKMQAQHDVPWDHQAPLIRAFTEAGGESERKGNSWSVTPAGADQASEFDLNDPTDRLLFQELHLLARTPEVMSPAEEAPHHRPDLFVMTSNSLPHVIDEYGEKSDKAAAAKALVDAAVRYVLERLGERYDQRVAATMLMDKRAAARPLDGQAHRILSTTPSPTVYGNVSSSNYTLAEIVQYQINMWTGIVLVLIMLTAICFMIHMEVQPDSLLYAKFQADTSSKLD